MKSSKVSGSSLPTSVLGSITGFPLLTACGADHIWQLSTMYYRSHDDSSEPVSFTSSEVNDGRLPTQEGKQTCQESSSTSKRVSFNQTPANAMECPKLADTKSSAVNVVL